MAGLPPGDPQLVSMIVNHLKTQGLFDQFRRDCLADVDTKPAYLNLKQRVDNFVSNHLSNHTWSPHLNKNQLRNNIRQLVLQSGMLEQGVDRIVAQVVDPKINHTFRPQVERVVREFLSPGCYVEEPAALPVPDEEKLAHNLPEQASSSAPAGNAMSILDTITTLNQEASSWASSSGEKNRKGGLEEPMLDLEEGEQDMNVVEEGEEDQEETGEEDLMLLSDFHAMDVKKEDVELTDSERERLTEMKTEEEEVGTPELADEGKDKVDSKISGTPKEEGQTLDVDPLRSPSEKHHMKQKARERLKEEYSLEDSDLEGLSDITVSSVHTSDLSSFEEESDDELPPSDSSEDGEVSSDGDKEEKKQTCTDNEEDKERKPRRQAYVHKPFLYSRYYSDSDDEVTVEQRRRSAAKDKEERLLKRQQNRERMEEKRKQRAAQLEEQNKRRQETASLSLEGPRAKEARKERKVLEKKMALSRKRKRDSRKEGDTFIKKKGDSECEYAKKEEGKAGTSKSSQPKSIRKVSESASLDERRRRKSGSTSEDSADPRKAADRSRTHSFILDLEQGLEESLKQRSAGKFDRQSRKELHPRERKDKERSLSDERAKPKQKSEKRVEGDGEESQQKELKVSSDDKGEKKIKVKSDKRTLGMGREARASVSESVCEEGSHKDAKKGKGTAVDATKVDKEREKDKEKGKEKDKAKEKDKTKGEKASAKSDLRQLLRDSTGSSEERSDMEPGPDNIKRREKPPKDGLKRSRNHNEDVEKTRHVEKGKIRSEAKDGEKEKPKVEDGTQESQKSIKPSSEMEKDPRKSKEIESQSVKGKAMEKCRSKSKEDVKVPSSSKVDKKAPGTDVKSKGGAPAGKPDTLKDRKKDPGMKAHRRGSEEIPAERNEDKSAKKLEKKTKIPEKKGEPQDEAKGIKGDDKSDKSSTPPVSSPVLEVPEFSGTPPQPKDACTDSDPSAAIVTPSVPDDTYDALSDITPEPDDEDDAVKRLREVEPRLPASEADALLTLVDICTSEDARLVSVTDVAVAVQGDHREATAADEGQSLPELAFQDADLKMKEAALTLLSMDPESIVSSSVATQEAAALAPQQMETAPPGGGEWQDSVHVQEEVENATDVGSQQMDVPVAEPEGKDASTAEVTEMVLSNAQSLAELGQQKDVGPGEERTDHTNVSPDKPEESLSVDSGTPSMAAEKENDSNVEELTEEMVVEPMDPKIMMESENMNKDQEETLEEKEDPVAGKGLPPGPEVVREKRRGQPSKLEKQSSNASKSDGQEDEKESDLSEKEGRVTRKRKLSNQKTGMPKDSGEESKDQQSQEDPSPESVEEGDVEKAKEPQTRRRGRSSKAPVEEDDQPPEPGKIEETPTRRGRRSGAQAKETPAGSKTKEKKDEEKAGETLMEKPQEKEEKGKEKMEPKKPGRRGRPPKAQTQPAATENAERSESKETTDACKPSRKRKRSEGGEETSEETQPDEKEVPDGETQEQEEKLPQEQEDKSPQEQEENLPQEVKESQSEDQEERKHEGHSGEQDKEKPKKKPVRRGRPSKGADVTQDDPEKKDKPDEKEGETKEEEEGEEEDEEGEGEEEEEGGTKRRTTTRLAARLEAERNKPSKPSTRASRLGGKEESAASTRGTRGQAVVTAAKGGRKREASPPALRTRGGQKSEEPPSKRAKR
ncbi:biorientation of chromosomes in cell division protein 1-like 1 isoform X2 [Hypomesus transpacificus]|uniref:biorientation of chromosomes in cell division protein 1-like 1 isoform X2 n=1 Tax=Hypomesus transpacificus TaxID=137520 RepID=UPI001F07E1EA|nr:biorientation of chromosomes in cell division protein 1-like 1 isoform X2 [Hypomesus transpacificus]